MQTVADGCCVYTLQGRLQTLPLCESSREDVIDSINQFLSPRNFAKVRILLGMAVQ